MELGILGKLGFDGTSHRRDPDGIPVFAKRKLSIPAYPSSFHGAPGFSDSGLMFWLAELLRLEVVL